MESSELEIEQAKLVRALIAESARMVRELQASREALISERTRRPLPLLMARSAARFVERLAPPLAAGALALPLAAGVGLAAALAERAARFLPMPAPLPTVSPRDPTLATLLILNYEGNDLLKKNLP